MKLKFRVALLAFVTAVTPLSLSAAGNGALGTPAQAIASRDAARTYASLPLRFEPAAEPGSFLARSGGYAVLVGADESAIAITDAKSGASRTLRFAFDHANAAARIEAIEPLPGVTNYYIGQDPGKWRLGVRNFAKLRARNVYPGVDVIYYGDNRRLEFDFVVAPMADPRPIALSLSGMDKLYVNADGELIAEVNGHPICFAKPYAYQKVAGGTKTVSVEYALAAPGKAQLKIGDYDKNLELVIDPTLSYSTYLGGSQGDTANGIAVDSSGNAYITGQTCSIGKDSSPIVFPSASPNTTGTVPAGSAAALGACDAYVTKLDTTGANVLFTTFLTGAKPTPANAFAIGYGITLDDLSLNTSPIPNGYPNVYVAGAASYTDMPGAGAYNGGDSDAFIAILDSTTGALIRSTYLGGNLADTAYAITVDPQQNVTVVGQTNSFNFPAYNGFEPITESYVAFVTKLDFGLHIDKPSATAPLYYGSSPMTRRHASSTDSCPSGNPCPATPNPNLTYYFFSAVYGGQLVAPPVTWPVNTSTGAIIGAYTSGVAVPYGAITVGTPYNCPSTTQTYPAVKLFALSAGTSGGINWGTCTSNTIGGTLVDSGGFSWEILAVAPFIAPLYATTEAYSVALDPAGDAFVVGGTNTADLHPSLPGPAPATGGTDWLPQADTHYTGTGAWIIKLLGKDSYMGASDAGTPVYLTPLETNVTDVTQQVDTARAVTVDSQGRAYVVGTVTGGLHAAGAGLNLSPLGSSPTYDAFLLRMNTAGSGIEFATYLGGSGNDQGLAVAVDAGGFAYVAGSTKSTDLTVVNPIIDGNGNSLKQLKGSQKEGYLAKVYPDGSALAMSAYLGGSSGDQANAVVLSKSGNGDIYLAGNTSSYDFPIVPVVASGSTVAGRSANAGNGDAFVSKILGASFPMITIAPASQSLTFVDQVVGFSSTTTETVTLTSTGQVPLTISSITASGDFTQTNTCGTGLPANTSSQNSCTITVTFTPSAVGTRSGALTITDDATNNPSPQTIGLTGNGVLVADSVTPTSLSFGSITVGTTSAAQTVTVKNTDSSQTLILSTVIASGDFTVSSNTCTTVLTPSQTCTVGVTFTPTVAGSRTGSLIINTTNGNSSLTVALTGNGNGTGSSSSSTSSDFTLTPSVTTVAVTKGTPATFTITLTPSTSFTGTVQLACTPTGSTTCSISPTSLQVVSGTTSYTATVTVNVPAGNTITIAGLQRPARLLATLLPFGAIGLVFAGRRRRWLLLLGLALCLAVGLVACGGGGSSSSQQKVTITATPQTGTAQAITVALSIS
jgi:hypothetical protein